MLMLYMNCIIALGNPGKQYEKTPHNIAWMILDVLFPDADWKKNDYANAMLAVVSVSGYSDPVLLVKPLTFMNLSGSVIPFLTREYGVSNDSCIVIHDDLDVLFGKTKIAYGRGHAGHNGVLSIAQHFDTKDFLRLRIGIAKQLETGNIIKPNVLGLFSKEDIESIQNQSVVIHNILKTILSEGKDVAMNKFN